MRPDQRSYDLADLTLRYLKRELKQESADDGQLAFDVFDDERRRSRETAMLHARAVLDLAEALDVEVEERGGTGSCAERRAAAGRPAGRDWSRPASPSTSTTSRRCERHFARRGARRPPTRPTR